MQPLEYCRQKTAASRSNFLSGFRCLKPEQRDALTVVYAYCRELDDVADECSSAEVAQTTLNWWRGDLAKVFADTTPEHPVHQALKTVCTAYGLPENELAAVIDGMEMDLTQSRYAAFSDLKRYCHHVAGTVGRLIARILGFRDAKTLEYAETMGLALQLTNIIRDVGEDARRGRIYLPVEELQRFSVPAQAILQAAPTAAFAKLMAFQIERAKQTYLDACALLPPCDKRTQKAGLVMAAVYYTLLKEIEADGAENVLRYKIALPGPRKTRIALKTWLFGFRP